MRHGPFAPVDCRHSKIGQVRRLSAFCSSHRHASRSPPLGAPADRPPPPAARHQRLGIPRLGRGAPAAAPCRPDPAAPADAQDGRGHRRSHDMYVSLVAQARCVDGRLTKVFRGRRRPTAARDRLWAGDAARRRCVHDGLVSWTVEYLADSLRTGLHKVIVDLGWSVEETGNLNFVSPSSRDPVIDPSFGKAKQSFAGSWTSRQCLEGTVQCANSW